MPFPILGTLVSLAAGYAYDKYTETQKRKELARSLKGYGNIKGLHSDVASAAKILVYYLREELGLPAYVIEGKRTKRRQNQLYAQGRTRAGEIVTWTRDSKHITGLAFDLGFAGYQPDDVPASWWSDAGEAWKELGGFWGGDWGKVDKMHFEA